MICLVHLIVDDDIGGVVPKRELADRLMNILLTQHGLNVLHGQAVAIEQRGIDFHAHRRACAAAD